MKLIPRKHDPEFKEKIVALVRAAKAAGTPSIASIAKEHGIGSSMPHEWLKQADEGALRATKNKTYDPAFKAKLVALFRAAKAAGTPTITSIAKEHGLSDALLYQWTQQEDRERAAAGADSKKVERKTTPKKEIRGYFSPETRQRALSMVESGLSVSEVGRQLGIKQQTIAYWRKNGAGSERQLALVPLDAQSNSTPVQQVRPLNGHAKDALLYLRHAERDLLELIREGKIARPDSAHLLALLALQELSKAINS